jgi:hypothetical protein
MTALHEQQPQWLREMLARQHHSQTQDRDEQGRFADQGGGDGGVAPASVAAAAPTQQESQALNNYTMGSGRINHAFRNGQKVPDEKQAIVDQMDSFLERQSLPETETVFRGIIRTTPDPILRPGPTFYEELEALEEGDEIEDAAYVSTSRSEKMAESFAAGAPLMRITLPAGSRAAYISNIINDPEADSEDEVLIARNSILLFDGRDGGYYNFTLMKH